MNSAVIQTSRRLDAHEIMAISVGGLLAPDVTIARIAGGPDLGFVDPVPAQNGYALSLDLIHCEQGELRLHGRSTPKSSTPKTGLRRNNCTFFDLRSSVAAMLEDPFDTLHCHMPRRYLDNLANAGGRPAMGDLRVVTGQGFHDPVITHLGLAMTAALARSSKLSQLVRDHTMGAL